MLEISRTNPNPNPNDPPILIVSNKLPRNCYLNIIHMYCADILIIGNTWYDFLRFKTKLKMAYDIKKNSSAFGI